MSKCAIAVGLAAAAMLAGTQVAAAADITEPVDDFGGWYISVTGGLNKIFDTEIEGDPIGEGDLEFDYGFRGGAAIGHYWAENWRGEIEFAYSSTDADEFSPDGGGGETDLDGSLDIFTALAKVDYEMQFGWWRPYIGVGAGVAVLSADDIEPEGGGPSLDGDDVVFAGAIEAGSKFILSDQVEIFTQSQLLITSDADLDFAGTNAEGSLDGLLVWSSSLGLRFRF
jgi:opacity protein-like surface antigen